MNKLLIVDDEPIVRIALSSMLNWADYDIEICGTAINGSQALEMMTKQLPDIVISDIKMPIMSGLELAKTSAERFGRPPLFIILTSYEEFQLAQQAIRYQVVDYLVKLELDKNILAASINKALAALSELRHDTSAEEEPQSVQSLSAFHDKFIIRLIHNLFESEAQMYLQAKNLGITFDSDYYVACHCYIKQFDTADADKKSIIKRYSSTLSMFRDLLGKYVTAHISSLDMEHFCIIICLNNGEIQSSSYTTVLRSYLLKTLSMVHNYFNVDIIFGLGRCCEKPLQIAESYQEARQMINCASVDDPVVFFELSEDKISSKQIFSLSLFRNDIVHAFEEYDTDTLTSVFNNICELFLSHPTNYLQAIDAASNILYLAITLLPDGENTVSSIFTSNPDGYHSIYKCTGSEQVVDWLRTLGEGLVSILNEQKRIYKNRTVANVQTYIREHITERLSLNEVASAFGISPNYLSMLFGKYSDTGFTEYITKYKIAKAKELMKQNNLKVYEISDMLCFESAFYFSKVFKKVTGYSPKDYMQTH